MEKISKIGKGLDFNTVSDWEGTGITVTNCRFKDFTSTDWNGEKVMVIIKHKKDGLSPND